MQRLARAAVIGSPIDHSRSPDLHAVMAAHAGVELDYQRLEATPPDAVRIAERVRTEPGWVGLSVTMPMKQSMVGCMDQVSDRVAAMSALNTVTVHPQYDGPAQLRGHNTDVDGITEALKHAGLNLEALTQPHSVGPDVGPPLVLGGGGTASAAVMAYAELGAPRIQVAARNSAKTQAAMSILAERITSTVEIMALEDLKKHVTAPAVVVSTLPAGGADAWASSVGSLARSGSLLLDAAYAGWPAPLTAAWEQAGGRAIHGLAMLVHQAVGQGQRFIGFEPTNEALAELCDVVGITPEGRQRFTVG